MQTEAAPLPATGTRWIGSKKAQRSKLFDSLFSKSTFLASWGTVALLVWIALAVGYAALPAVKQYGFGFIIGTQWDTNNDQYGALPLIYGTMVSATLALLISTPLGVAIGSLICWA